MHIHILFAKEKIQITTMNYEQSSNNRLNYQTVYLTLPISKTNAQYTFCL